VQEVGGPRQEVAGSGAHLGVGHEDEDAAHDRGGEDGEDAHEGVGFGDPPQDAGTVGPVRRARLPAGCGHGGFAHRFSSVLVATATSLRAMASSRGTPAIMRPRTPRGVSGSTTPTILPRYMTAMRSDSE